MRIDHLVWYSADLAAGEKHFTGWDAAPAFGGAHPGQGTRNSVLSLGDSTYVEILARDPAQTGGTLDREIAALKGQGLYHWAVVSGVAGPPEGFEYQPTPWQTATVFFAVIDLVAAVGLWLAAAWGAVVWLTACVSMAAVEVFFPQVYGGRIAVVAVEFLLLFCYLFLAIQSAREHPN